MLYIAWIISLIGAFYLGYQCKIILKRVETLEEVVKIKVDKPKISDLPQSEFIDPYDEVQTAQFEHQQMLKKLNPDIDNEK